MYYLQLDNPRDKLRMRIATVLGIILDTSDIEKKVPPPPPPPPTP